jgi:hypothetical protein
MSNALQNGEFMQHLIVNPRNSNNMAVQLDHSRDLSQMSALAILQTLSLYLILKLLRSSAQGDGHSKPND